MRLRVLINSYTCCPDMGSEPGMGWHWITSLAHYCECYVVSEGEFRPQVEQWMTQPANAATAEHMHFYWLPIGGDDAQKCSRIRQMCWNQGDWRFYYYYRKWQKRVADGAREIIDVQNKQGEPIHILHQLNMIGFREPGYLWQVSKEKNVPFVWGPVGGMKMFPLAYASSWKQKCFNWLKNQLTITQLKYSIRVKRAVQQSKAVIASIPDSQKAISKYYGCDSIIIPETGCEAPLIRQVGANLHGFSVLWVGKFDYRKRLDIAISAISATKNKNISLTICGSGNQKQIEAARKLVRELNIEDQVSFAGLKKNSEVKSEMLRADILLFTSVSEDTSTVVMEAISAQLPVVCFDCCMAAVINDRVGIKVPLSTPRNSIADIAETLNQLYINEGLLMQMRQNCLTRASELSWGNKANQIVRLYRTLV